jgi:ketosteroid isomerase-like protein
MSNHSRDEVEAAFRTYFQVGPVGEDWIGWSQLFTDDAVYTDHYWGVFRGPEEIQQFLESTMSTVPGVYTAMEWYVIDGDRVVWKGLNRGDNPDPDGPDLNFPSLQVMTYAGDGKWSSEEDWWIAYEMQQFGKRYAEALATHDPDFGQQMTRRNWGTAVDWARPAPGHVAKPSWLGRDDVVPARRLSELTVGERHPR